MHRPFHLDAFANWISPIISPLVFTAATNSASPELKMILRWVVAQVLMQCLPRMMHPPLVLFAVRRHLAQSESEKPSSSRHASWNLYSNTTPGCAIKYLANLRSLDMSLLLGSAMPLQISLVANCISARSAAK